MHIHFAHRVHSSLVQLFLLMAWSHKIITVAAPVAPHPTTSSLPDFSWPTHTSVSTQPPSPAATTPQLRLNGDDTAGWIGRSVFIILCVICASCMAWHTFGCYRGDCKRWNEPEIEPSIQLQDLYPLPPGLDGDEWETFDLNDNGKTSTK